MPVGAAGPKGSTQKETAAPREFGRAYVSTGSKASKPIRSGRQSMSALLQKLTWPITPAASS